MSQSEHICYLAGGSRIGGGQSPELNGMQFSVMKWEEHLLPKGGPEPFGSSSEDDVGHFSVCTGVVLVRNLMMQTKIGRAHV